MSALWRGGAAGSFQMPAPPFEGLLSEANPACRICTRWWHRHHERLEELKQSLLEVDVLLDIQLSEKIHDREVRIDNGWTVKIGRGLDFYQKPDAPSVLPSVSGTTSAPGERVLSRLNGWPVRSPVNASLLPSQAAAHDSGSMRFATPSS